jgi:hypothetical protein
MKQIISQLSLGKSVPNLKLKLLGPNENSRNFGRRPQNVGFLSNHWYDAQNIKSRISQQPLVGSDPYLSLRFK